ncbi:hypothetical protein EK21DRAFT_114667 [Setomelanomma holmii]|uniref:Uncharacterized protein n=1 Tax=Setomelanomma holmii TaxID=210430 RepID=A0A9P4H4N1_9PLEO|nr:hypothetical protein EK21DRAFT_114667 [Setomelanomma holmii]
MPSSSDQDLQDLLKKTQEQLAESQNKQRETESQLQHLQDSFYQLCLDSGDESQQLRDELQQERQISNGLLAMFDLRTLFSNHQTAAATQTMDRYSDYITDRFEGPLSIEEVVTGVCEDIQHIRNREGRQESLRWRYCAAMALMLHCTNALLVTLRQQSIGTIPGPGRNITLMQETLILALDYADILLARILDEIVLHRGRESLAQGAYLFVQAIADMRSEYYLQDWYLVTTVRLVRYGLFSPPDWLLGQDSEA